MTTPVSDNQPVTFSQLMEALRPLLEAIQSIQGEIHSLGERMEAMENRMEAMGNRVGTMENRMATKDDLAKVNYNIFGLHNRIAGLEDRVSMLESNMATKDDVRLIFNMQDELVTLIKKRDLTDTLQGHTLYRHGKNISDHEKRLKVLEKN